jgi:arginine exporter protein ArgO
MERTRIYGGLICLGVLAFGLLFMIGVFTGSYLALAVPVTIITLTLLGLIFWIGYTIWSIKVEPPSEEK